MSVPRNELDGDPETLLARWPSYGPAWDAAVAAGVDVAVIEENLRLTPAERLAELDRMSRLHEALRPAPPERGDVARPR